MSHLALYRKFRPRTFEEVVGQRHITQALTNQIKSGQISHAYLFTGTRGTGKTSIAKIFAKAINCTANKSGSPCNDCDVCKSLNDSANVDILEIDAASNNRVDEIRDLRERVKYPPIVGKYKVYIIDEVHMLTDSAFNALLKTLEEPPPYVVFILATTEVQKLPATILSRCMKFDFKLVSEEDMEKHIKNIFDKSQVKYEDEGVAVIARLAAGSVRDSLSIADMCVSFSNGFVSYDAVNEAVGITDRETLGNITNYIFSGDAGKLLDEIERVSRAGKNIIQLSKDLVGYLRDLIVVKSCSDADKILKLPKAQIEDLTKLKEITTSKQLIEVLSKLSVLDNEFRYSSSPRNLFEITLLAICEGESCKLENVEMRLKILENKLIKKD